MRLLDVVRLYVHPKVLIQALAHNMPHTRKDAKRVTQQQLSDAMGIEVCHAGIAAVFWVELPEDKA